MSARPLSPETTSKIPAVGEVVNGKYRVDGMAGTGGMGVVVSARHVELGHQVAIKFLSSDDETTSAAVERFLREGQVVASLQSDHVVRIYDVGRLESGTPFMVMELLRGQDLSAKVSNSGGVSVEQAVDWILQAIHAIAEAHERGIVHRDLKPSNLFLTQRSDGTDCVKVLDFGISKRIAVQDPSQHGGQLTATRQVVGSPAYMSPEQVRNARDIDHRVDIWALGMTLYELLAGRTAFDADTFPAVCASIVADAPPPLRTFAPGVPPGLERIVMRCLEKDPAKRFSSVTALANELRPYGSPLAVNTARLAASSARKPISTSEDSSTLVSSQSPKRSLARLTEKSSDSEVIADRTMNSVGFEARPLAPVRPVAESSSKRWAWFALALLGFGIVAVWKVRHSGKVMQDAPTPSVTPAATQATFWVTFESSPPNAQLWDGSDLLGTTPLRIKLDHRNVQISPKKLLLKKDGYEPFVASQGDSPHDIVFSAQLTPLAAVSTSSPKAPNSPPKGSPKGTATAKTARAPAGGATGIGSSSTPSDIRSQR